MASLDLPGFLQPLQPSVERIRRADPFLMSAAIAYNFFFAIVPLSIAFFATISLIGGSTGRLDELRQSLALALPPEMTEFFASLITDTQNSLSQSAEIVIVIAALIALYSGSRGVYAVIKAIRLMQATTETRPWVVVRGLGLVFTLGAGVSLLVGQLLIVLGAQIAGLIDYYTGFHGADVLADLAVVPALALWTIALIASIYTWGPPRRVGHPIISASIATLIIGLGTWLFAVLMPLTDSSTIAVLGSIGILLVWVYFMAFVVITIPELVGGTIAVAAGLARDRSSDS